LLGDRPSRHVGQLGGDATHATGVHHTATGMHHHPLRLGDLAVRRGNQFDVAFGENNATSRLTWSPKTSSAIRSGVSRVTESSVYMSQARSEAVSASS
jgi:hypothetical protein